MRARRHQSSEEKFMSLDLFEDELLKNKWPETLVDYVNVVAHKLEIDSVPNSKSIALKAVMALAEFDGGRPHYLPKGDALKRAIRDKAVFDDFTGFNHDELTRKYKLTQKQIYLIISEQRKIHTHKIQGRLFDNG